MSSSDAPRPGRTTRPLGTHVPAAGGLARTSLTTARRLGAETLQIFLANPRGWATPEGDPRQDALFREGCAEDGIPVYVHAPYLINFGSANGETVERSVLSLAHSLRRGEAVGARGVVVHTGSATGGRPRTEALRQVHEHLLPLLEDLGPDAPDLLIESTAGQGASLCSLAEDFGPYFEALEHHPRLGICLDTCHFFAAGHDLAAADGIEETVQRLEVAIGPGRLGLVHANDSKDVLGALKDRHERIGRGRIGAEAFARLLAHPATEGVPLVLETPGGEEAWAEDLRLLRRLREGGAA